MKSCSYKIKKAPRKEKGYYEGEVKWRCEVNSFGKGAYDDGNFDNRMYSV